MRPTERLRWLWQKLKGWKLLILAGVLTGAEFAVSLGFKLPGSDLIPVELRGLAIAALGLVAFILRTLAARSERRCG